MSETLADIGEFGLIRRIDRIIKEKGLQAPEVTQGIGDDCAIFKPREGLELLVTCDSVIEGRHFLKDHIDPLSLGRRAMALNISDIGAMGGRPRYALISLGLEVDIPIGEVEAMYKGFLMELNPLGGAIIGGNLTRVSDAMFIDITLIGDIEPGKIVRRSTAKAGDIILITGYPGEAAAGLKLLLKGPQDESLHNHPLVQAYNTPSHRAREGQAVSESGLATSMIDTSDGFLGDLGHICRESAVGALLIQEQLPISGNLRQAADRLGLDPLELILRDSDDYELIITCPPEGGDAIQAVVSSVSDVTVTEVGRITADAGQINLKQPDGGMTELQPAGWDHFMEG
ncbi:thiamine-phosphate kinase [Thermodesulfobacteriota bacterium]